MHTTLRTLCLSLTLASTLLAGCGGQPGLPVVTQEAAVAADGFARLGFGAEGGEQPSLAFAGGEWVVAYAGTRVGERDLYVRTSADGDRWGRPEVVASGDYASQAPCLVADDAGTLHLYFASNRDGEQFALYHAHRAGGVWHEARPVPGFSGVTDLAVAHRDGRFVIAAEVAGVGLVVAESADMAGDRFSPPQTVTPTGFAPALTGLPDGRFLLAFTRGSQVQARLGKPGAWGAEHGAVTAADRVRDPALVWMGDHGELRYAERSGNTYRPRARRFDAQASFAGAPVPAAPDGDVKGAAVAVDHNGKIGAAWGMRSTSGQQGVIFALAAQ